MIYMLCRGWYQNRIKRYFALPTDHVNSLCQMTYPSHSLRAVLNLSCVTRLRQTQQDNQTQYTQCNYDRYICTIVVLSKHYAMMKQILKDEFVCAYVPSHL